MCLLALPSLTWSKRAGPPLVSSVIYQNTKYIAPNSDGRRAYIEAQDVKTGRKLWEQTIFTTPVIPLLEEDVQWVFIKGLRIEKGHLVITDEKNRRYFLNLITRKVKRLI
jgi:hypothetical protein